jgi:hypothetical protein
MAVEMLVGIYAAIMGIGGVRWALRIRRGQGRLPSSLFRSSVIFSEDNGNPDRYLLPAAGIHLGMAMSILWNILDELGLHGSALLLLLAAPGILVILASGGLGLAIMLFNRPRFVLPPSVRDHPGTVARWAGRGRSGQDPDARPAASRRR